MDYTALATKLAKMGKDQVRLKLSQNAFQKRKVDFILWWLEHGEAEVETTPEQVGEQTPVEQLDTPSGDDVMEYANQLDKQHDEIQADMDEMIKEAEESGEVTVIFDDKLAGDSIEEIAEVNKNVGVGEASKDDVTVIGESDENKLATRVNTGDSDYNALIPAEDVEPGGADLEEVKKTVADPETTEGVAGEFPSGEQSFDSDSDNTETDNSEDTQSEPKMTGDDEMAGDPVGG